MTTEVDDRRRRRGGVLMTLIAAVIGAWLVYLWLDGLGSSSAASADAATTTTTMPAATTTTAAPTTTTTTVAATTTTTPPAADPGVIDAAIADYSAQLGSIDGETERLEGLFASEGRSAFALRRFEDGAALVLARLGDAPDGHALVAACGEGFGRECTAAVEAGAPAPWLEAVLTSLGELDDVPQLGIGVVGDEYTLLGQVASDETKQRIGAAVAAAIEPDLTLINELEVVDSEVITGDTQTALEDLDLKGITFESGSAEITAEGQAILDEAVAVLSDAVGVTVEVGGHTDSAGGAASNQRLSQARAEAVVAYLVDGGVDEAILTAVGYGEEQPVADNATSDGREQNRRIEFTVSAA